MNVNVLGCLLIVQISGCPIFAFQSCNVRLKLCIEIFQGCGGSRRACSAETLAATANWSEDNGVRGIVVTIY